MNRSRTYNNWLLQLQTWAASGDLFAAGFDALQLKSGRRSKQLKRIVDRLAQGDKRDLPPVEVLPSSAMSGAIGAYAASTGTIYLNHDWLKDASSDSIKSVLTEELGHHLDQLLSEHDTEGDEGEVFANLLLDSTVDLQGHNHHTAGQNDHIKISINN